MGRLGAEEAGLYGLVWRRIVTSQMVAAGLDRVRVALASEEGDVVLTATGAGATFDGFMYIWREGSEEDAYSGRNRSPIPVRTDH